MNTISYKAGNTNTKLTDFEDTKSLVVSNSVKNVPSVKKQKCEACEQLLESFF